MLDRIRYFVEKNNLIPNGSSIVLGLSGGPDSVFLLHFLSHLKEEGLIKSIITAHLDHEWRTDSAKDADFCRIIAQKFNLPFIAQKISNLKLSLKFNGSKEEFGRNARRLFLESVKKDNNYDLIALAHHEQDQQETFFIRLIRGASLSGLISIKPKHGNYIRPLLETSKKEILDYLKENNIPYIQDPSNILDDFLRNRIRKKVIPAIVECDPRFDKKFKETINNLRETEQFLESITKKRFDEISSYQNGKLAINIKEFLKLHKVIRYRVILQWLCKQNLKFPVSKSFFDEIIKFLKQPGSKEHNIYHDWNLVKKKEIAYIKAT